MSDPSKLITIDWTVLKDDGPDAYVLEFTDGQLVLTFGPMPKGVVEAFLAERRKQIAAIFDRIIRDLNNAKDPSNETEQVADQAVSQR